MGGVRGTVGKNNCNNYVKGSDCLYGWENGVGVRMGCYGRMLLMLAETRITRILALFVMCGVERFTLSLNQSISLTLVLH